MKPTDSIKRVIKLFGKGVVSFGLECWAIKTAIAYAMQEVPNVFAQSIVDEAMTEQVRVACLTTPLVICLMFDLANLILLCCYGKRIWNVTATSEDVGDGEGLKESEPELSAADGAAQVTQKHKVIC